MLCHRDAVIAHNHLPIIEAIDQGDVEKTIQLLTIHIASAGDLIADGWDSFIEAQTEQP